MPIFSVNRGGNFSEAGVHKIFGLLRIGLKLKVVVLWVGIALAVISAAVLILLVLRWRKLKQSMDGS